MLDATFTPEVAVVMGEKLAVVVQEVSVKFLVSMSIARLGLVPETAVTTTPKIPRVPPRVPRSM